MSKETAAVHNVDCLSCRLISGFGVMGMGVYIYAKSSNQSKIQTGIMRLIAFSAVGLGLARLFHLPILKSNKNTSK